MVTMSAPSCITASVRHETTRVPLSRIVHEPQAPWSQPFLLPVSPARSRSRSRSEVRLSTATWRPWPLIRRWTTADSSAPASLPAVSQEVSNPGAATAPPTASDSPTNALRFTRSREKDSAAPPPRSASFIAFPLRADTIHCIEQAGFAASAHVRGYVRGMRVVLLHGLTNSKRAFDRLRPLLDDFDVTALDLPGHGAHATQPFMATIAGMAAAMTPEIPGPCLVLGHSLGGVRCRQGPRTRPQAAGARPVAVAHDVAAGHTPTWETPDRVADALRRCASLSGPR